MVINSFLSILAKSSLLKKKNNTTFKLLSKKSPCNSNKALIERVQEIEEVEAKVTIELLAAMEPENCFKRLFCSAATGLLQEIDLSDTL